MSLCQYKDKLGRPGEGAHFHVAGVAVVDVALTLLGAWGIARYSGLSPVTVFIMLMILAVIFHWLFCVQTAGMAALSMV